MKRGAVFKESLAKAQRLDSGLVGDSLLTEGEVLLSVLTELMFYVKEFIRTKVSLSLVCRTFNVAMRRAGFLTRSQMALLEKLEAMKPVTTVIDKIPEECVISENVGAGKTTVMLVFAAQQAAKGKRVAVYATTPIIHECITRLKSMMHSGSLPRCDVTINVIAKRSESEGLGRTTGRGSVIFWSKGILQGPPELDIILVDDKASNKLPKGIAALIRDHITEKKPGPVPLLVFFRSGGYSDAQIDGSIDVQLDKPKVTAQFIYTGLCMSCEPEFATCDSDVPVGFTWDTPLIQKMNTLTSSSRRVLVYAGIPRINTRCDVLKGWLKRQFQSVFMLKGIQNIHRDVEDFNKCPHKAALVMSSKHALSGLNINADTVLLMDCFPPPREIRKKIRDRHLMCCPDAWIRGDWCKRPVPYEIHQHLYGMAWPNHFGTSSIFKTTKILHQVMGRAVRPKGAGSVNIIAISNTALGIGPYMDAITHLFSAQKPVYVKHMRKVMKIEARLNNFSRKHEVETLVKQFEGDWEQWFSLRAWNYVDMLAAEELRTDYRLLDITERDKEEHIQTFSLTLPGDYEEEDLSFD